MSDNDNMWKQDAQLSQRETALQGAQ